MTEWAEGLLRMRFGFGYSTWLIAGLLLAFVALGRRRRLHNGRRRLYLALASLCLGVAFSGLAGLLGVWNYGTITPPLLLLDRNVLSALFSVGVVWVAASLLVIAAMVIRQEMRAGRHVEEW